MSRARSLHWHRYLLTLERPVRRDYFKLMLTAAFGRSWGVPSYDEHATRFVVVVCHDYTGLPQVVRGIVSIEPTLNVLP